MAEGTVDNYRCEWVAHLEPIVDCLDRDAANDVPVVVGNPSGGYLAIQFLEDPTPLWNQALAKLGEKRIGSYTENSLVRDTMAGLWESVRQEVIREHVWQSATRQADYNVTGECVRGLDGVYAYDLPLCSLRVLEVRSLDGNGTDLYPVKWKIVGKQIYTQSECIRVWYLMDMHNISGMEPLMRDAIAAKLAFEASGKLTRDDKLRAALGEQYRTVLMDAAHADSTEQRAVDYGGRVDSYFARFTGGSFGVDDRDDLWGPKVGL